HDVETESETVRSTIIGSLKGLEDRRESTGADTDAGVAHLDPQFRAATASRDEHATPGRRIVDRVAYQVPQHAGQQDRVTERGPTRRGDKKGDPFQPCRSSELPRET